MFISRCLSAPDPTYNRNSLPAPRKAEAGRVTQKCRQEYPAGAVPSAARHAGLGCPCWRCWLGSGFAGSGRVPGAPIYEQW